VPTAITEKGVLEIWQDSLQNRTDLLTEDNESVRIVYPGRRNDDRGADFKDAVIATGRKQLKGDIEIHVKASNWWAHGHHRDPAYNRVILHVVYQNDCEKAIVLQNGSSAPTLALHAYIKTDSRPALPAIPCRNDFYRGNMSFIGRILDEAGEQRFLARAAYFKEAITQVGAGQALYRGIMTALGYSKNKQPMEELAGRMPLKKLATASDEMPDNQYLARCQALLTGMAGLLPSQRGGGYPNKEYLEDWEAKLENLWANSRERAYMSAADWRFFKVRPGNHPVRRLAAMSYLLLRYREKGLLDGLEEKLQEAVEDSGSCFLEQALLVAPDSHWGCYLDFGIAVSGIAPALLGKERAAEIVINVLLPFACAKGLAIQNEKAMEIYRHYSAPAENTLVKHMRRQLGISKPFIANARRQQGLIHIYKTLCAEGKCGKCPLNQ
jgi:hypothetical protein